MRNANTKKSQALGSLTKMLCRFTSKVQTIPGAQWTETSGFEDTAVLTSPSTTTILGAKPGERNTTQMPAKQVGTYAT